MKICHLTSVHSANDIRIFFKECDTLARAGHDVFLIAQNPQHIKSTKIKIISIDTLNCNRLYRMTKITWLIYRHARKIKADIYHFHDPELMLFGILLKLSGSKVVYDIHENTPAMLLSRPYIKSHFVRKVLSRILDIVEKTCAGFYDLIITATPDISERFSRFNPTTIRNLPILTNLEDIQDFSIVKKQFTIIYVGGITRIRGIVQLIQSLEYIDNTELWLLGSFESEDFQNECEQLSAWRRVRYFGIVEPCEIFSYLKCADIGIITYLPEPNHITSLPTKTFEYMACGLPMIMSCFTYWESFFKQSALYVDPADSQDIAVKINLLRNDETLRKKMARYNFYLAKNFYSWENESKILNQAYSSIFEPDYNTR